MEMMYRSISYSQMFQNVSILVPVLNFNETIFTITPTSHVGVQAEQLQTHFIEGDLCNCMKTNYLVFDSSAVCTMSWSGGPYTVDENRAAGTEIIPSSDLTSTFPETAAATAFSITSVSPGAATLFSIDPSTGAVSQTFYKVVL